MKCRICGREASIKLETHNIALCEPDFIEFFKRRVRRFINRYGILKKDDRILVAISGGKDSLALWHFLHKEGYITEGLHIDIGIEGYSEEASQYVERFSKKFGLKVHKIRVKDVMFRGAPEVARILRRPTCSVCGKIKRYIMETFAKEKGFDAIATGHNLDDEVGLLLGNLLNWQEGYLARQGPVLKAEGGFVKKVKPFAGVLEEEVRIYATLNNIEHFSKKCPYSKGATLLIYKNIMNQIEENSPGTKIRFYQGFLRVREIFKREELQLKPCEKCGYPTTAGVCSVCRMKDKLTAILKS